MRASQNIGWPIRLEELHNRAKELEVKGKVVDNVNYFCCKFSHQSSIVFNSICRLKLKNRAFDVLTEMGLECHYSKEILEICLNGIELKTNDSHLHMDNDFVLNQSPGTVGNRIISRLRLASQVAKAIGKSTNNTSQCTRVSSGLH